MYLVFAIVGGLVGVSLLLMMRAELMQPGLQIGGVTGGVLADAGTGVAPQDTYYVAAYFRYLLSLAAVFTIFAGWYYWFPKITGYMYNETLGKQHFWITFVGVNTAFFPQYFIGLAGMPWRYADYPDAFGGWNYVSSIGVYIAGFSALVFLAAIGEAFMHKRVAGDNPWGAGATTLEWTVSSPPPSHSHPLRSLICREGAP